MDEPHASDSKRIPPEASLESGNKRRRKEDVKPRKKQRRVAQRGLCDLCIDELYIIFAYIYPMDLLNLARTCKSLRGVLIHKSSLFLWKAALGRVEGLPPCPADLTEPEYTNLAFYTRCYGCGKPAYTILWNLRRRYCPTCRIERLCSPVPYGIPTMRWVYLNDWCKRGKEPGKWADKDQVESFVREYNQSSNKTAFLDEKLKQFRVISSHARECEDWQKKNGRAHRYDLEVLRMEREASIFQRLRQHGYGPEIEYSGEKDIQQAKPMFFKSRKLLSDNEWNEMWPELLETMNNFREQRLNRTVYLARRRLLISEYNQYVTHRPSNAPTFDLLPHVADLDSFPPFQNVIRAPEETPVHGALFASAFMQLPALVGEWKKQLDMDVAGLVKIPPDLSMAGKESNRAEACASVANTESHRTDLDKLQLACAVFCTCSNCFTYPEVFFNAFRHDYPLCNQDTPKRAGPEISMLEEAPYIVYACGLDPNLATADDMDRRNARLKCLYCEKARRIAIVMDWRSAMSHALHNHSRCLSEAPRWQLFSDEHIDAIQTIEASLTKRAANELSRCLICQPRVGDFWRYSQIIGHLRDCHSVDTTSMKQGVHYEHLNVIDEYVGGVEMVEEEGGKVVFRSLI